MSEEPEPLKPLRPPPPGVIQGYGWDDRYKEIVTIFPHEPLERYIKNGFHPVALGDKFCDGRYTIRHKLGAGGKATVWLARDGRDNLWVALKIKQARESLSDIEQESEIKTLKYLENKYALHHSPGPRWFVRLLDYFQHRGPNGTHTCIVTELLGPSIAQAIRVFRMMMPWKDMEREEVEIFRPDTMLRSSRQLLEAVDIMKDWEIVHGDISPNNVVFTCQTVMDDEQELIEALGGEPTVAEYSASEAREECLPKHLVKTASWNCWYDCPEESVRLIDWGESFPSADKVSSIAQPMKLRSPETFFIGHFDHRHDLWRVGCVIHEMFYLQSPFGSSYSKQYLIDAMTLVMGPLPSAWHDKWMDIIQEEPGFKPATPREAHFQPLNETFEARRQFIISLVENDEDFTKPDFIEDDYQGLRCLLGVMEGLMQHDPEKRISAKEALAKIQWVDQWDSLGWESGSEFEADEEAEKETTSVSD